MLFKKGGSILLPLFVCQMLCVFNPEHDLCLANGSRHYVPPASALAFASRCCDIMGCLYPDALCLPASVAGEALRHPEKYGFSQGVSDSIVPWGWNAALKQLLLKQGFPEGLMPSDDTLSCWRRLQHRSTLLPLQPDSRAVTSVEEVVSMVGQYGSVVMKAPWSGSGRGLRWVTKCLSSHDEAWLSKVVREQHCAIVEPRRQVADDFALEYRIDNDGLHFIGFSLFKSANGVYQGNILLSDDAIRRRVGFTTTEQDNLESWLTSHIVPFYQGPLGVDCLLDTGGRCHISELNLRHTMGHVAHAYLSLHPEKKSSISKNVCIFALTSSP